MFMFLVAAILVSPPKFWYVNKSKKNCYKMYERVQVCIVVRGFLEMTFSVKGELDRLLNEEPASKNMWEMENSPKG